jgi:peptide/nickel transport system permease protein
LRRSGAHDASLRRAMLKRSLDRLLGAIAVLVGATVLLFALTFLMPGDPATAMLGPQATPEAVTAFRAAMGLDLPLWRQLLRFFWHVLQGDLGTDVISGRPILGMVLEVLPYTASLTFAAIGLAVLIGVPLGCYAATHRGTVAEQAVAVLSVAAIAVPSYIVAMLLLVVFATEIGWLPALGAGEPGDWGDELRHMALPALALAAGWIGYLARLMRASLLEVLGEPYIRTSRAFGLARRLILYKYALKNALIPTVAVLGLGIGRLLGGAVLVEIIFARPGIGKLLYDALGARNYLVVQGTVLVVVGLFVATNLVVDLLYGWIDPRLRTRGAHD